MKQINNYTVVIEPDEDGYHGFAPALRGCHTFGLTIDETLRNLNEAIALYVEAVTVTNNTPYTVNNWNTSYAR